MIKADEFLKDHKLRAADIDMNNPCKCLFGRYEGWSGRERRMH